MIASPATEVMPFHVDPHGVVRIGKTRVSLDTVMAAFADGATAEEIVQQYPTLDLGDVYYVIGYSLRRPEEVEQYLRHRREQSDAVRQQNETRFDPHGIRDRLLRRRVHGAS